MVAIAEEKPVEVHELPPPPRGIVGHLKAIGPGIILASLSIGAGEWFLFPAMILKYGPMLMWTAAVGCILQAVGVARGPPRASPRL